MPDRLRDDFLVYWQFLAFAVVRGGRRMFGPTFDRTKLDNLTLGLDRDAARNLHKVPLAIARLSATRRITARLSRTYDAVLMPTLADETPRIGYLDPMAPYEQVMERLLNWVTFTPLQNATGDPAISLPLGGIRDGNAGRHDAVDGPGPGGPAARTGLRARRGAALAAHSANRRLRASPSRGLPVSV